MSFFDIFKPAAPVAQTQSPQQQQAQAPNQQTQPGNIPNPAPGQQTVATAGTAPNGAVPNNPEVVAGAAKSGLDAFADIWNTTAGAGAQGQPLFNVSQDKLMEAARKQQFNTGVTPEMMAKVTAGGPEAVQAMVEMMNTMAQNVYAQSAHASTQLITGALDKSQFAKQGDIDTRVKALGLENNLRAENPMFSHPAAKPMLESIQSQLLVKFPNATQSELTTMAKDYLVSFASAANAPAEQAAAAQKSKVPVGEDWNKFFDTQ